LQPLLLLVVLQGDPDPTTVSKALTSVFRQRAYDRSIPQSIMDRIMRWIFELIGRGLSAIVHTPGSRWLFVGTVVVLAAGLAIHALTGRVGDGAGARIAGSRRRGESSGDPWALAQRLAAEGDYTEAAHALYQGLLRALARRDNIRLHESKTVGDYTRELRSRASQRFGPFREFARTYEVVVYGLGTCDRDRYDRLHRLALAITAPQHG
jgi:Domain of unknown function (DUF4129)